MRLKFIFQTNPIFIFLHKGITDIYENKINNLFYKKIFISRKFFRIGQNNNIFAFIHSFIEQRRT